MPYADLKVHAAPGALTNVVRNGRGLGEAAKNVKRVDPDSGKYALRGLEGA